MAFCLAFFILEQEKHRRRKNKRKIPQNAPEQDGGVGGGNVDSATNGLLGKFAKHYRVWKGEKEKGISSPLSVWGKSSFLCCFNKQKTLQK